MKDFVVNLSTVFCYLARDDRPAAAAGAGFARAESWWDFESAIPPEEELRGFLRAVGSSGLELVAMNSHGGDRGRGERGLACLPDRVGEFRDSIESVCRVAAATGASRFNVTFGRVDETRWSRAEQFDTAVANYRWAARRVAEVGGTVLIEALSREGNEGYPFYTGRDVVSFIDEFLGDVSNIGYLFDAYHLAANGLDPVKVWDDVSERVAHVQFADHPGRGPVGTGSIDFEGLLTRITNSNYPGLVALEYMGDS